MNKGGRPRDPVWIHFDEVSKDGKSYARCKKCCHELFSKVGRMKAHNQKCNNEGDKEVNVKEEVICSAPEKRQRDDSPPPTKKRATSLQQPVERHFTKTTSAEKESFDMEIAKFFYSCNIPFSVAEHPQFMRVIKLLHPGYTPPTQKAIGGPLLDKVTNQVRDIMRSDISGKTATLVEDGWSNIHNEPVIASSLQVDGKSYFLDSYYAGAMTKSGQNCASALQKTIKKASDEYNCIVRSVVTDNARNMEKMREIIKSDDPSLTVYGCSAHWLNLLGQDITPPTIMKHIVEIQKYLRNHHKPNAWLSEISGSKKPQLPGDTRWKSQLTCIESFLHNRALLVQMVQEHENDMDSTICSKIMNHNIFKNARDLAEQLKPVADAIDICQKDHSNLADACDIWLKLKSNPALEPHKRDVLKRFGQAMTTEHLVAYKLHPKYQGKNLSLEQINAVHSYLMNIDASFMATLVAFEGQSTPFLTAYFSGVATAMSPTQWWRAVKRCGVDEKFSDFANNLLSCPASSASIERIFSNFAFVHTKVRNRLGIEKASNLVFCYRMLRGCNELDY